MDVASNRYDSLIWNAFPTANQDTDPSRTTQTTFRYEDNVHIRGGSPVSYAQIGFGSSSAPAGFPRPHRVLLP